MPTTPWRRRSRCRVELDRLNADWEAEGRPVLDIGIGINSGEMIAGNIGSNAIMSYTVIGDAVNLGSRLESLNKEYGTHILISEATSDRLTIAGGDAAGGRRHGQGPKQPVVVYEVVATECVDEIDWMTRHCPSALNLGARRARPPRRSSVSIGKALQQGAGRRRRT